MNKRILILFILSLVGTGAGYYMSSIYKCNDSGIFCENLFTNGLAIYYGFGAFAIVFFILLIVPKALHAWKTFALWFLPFAIDFYIFYPGPGRSFFDIMPSQPNVYRSIATIYVALSVVVIVLSFLLRRFTIRNPFKITSKRGQFIYWIGWTVYVLIILGMHLFA